MTFVITGPDMAQILPQLDGAASPEALREDILRVFADLTGELPAPGKHYYVDQFAKTHVGMSTGWISGDFWQATAIPLLMERLEQANRS